MMNRWSPSSTTMKPSVVAVSRLLGARVTASARSRARATTSTRATRRARVRARRHPHARRRRPRAHPRDARAGGGEAPTVFMTASGHMPTAVEAMKEGAVDLLAKPFPTGELARRDDARDRSRHERIHDERRALGDALAHNSSAHAARGRGLRARRVRTAQQAVAALIGTTEKTVKVHRSRVMQKLHVSSVAALVRLRRRAAAESRARA